MQVPINAPSFVLGLSKHVLSWISAFFVAAHDMQTCNCHSRPPPPLTLPRFAGEGELVAAFSLWEILH
jgi:hypothetical protein